MMTRKPCWVDSDNKPHFTKEECQAAEIARLMTESGLEYQAFDLAEELVRKEAADWIVKNTDAILNVLTTDENSRPKARKENGAVRKSRKPKTPTVIAAENVA